MTQALERWSERTGTDRFIAIPTDRSEPIPTGVPQHVCGWYAQYKEGLFAYWQSAEQEFVRWRDDKVVLKPGMEIEWKSQLLGRQFQVQGHGKTLLTVSYHTLLRNLGDVFDDWWGLVDDLPSFVHSGHQRGTLIKQLHDWNKRSNAQQGVPADGPRPAGSARG
jgi:hypothetical protein